MYALKDQPQENIQTENREEKKTITLIFILLTLTTKNIPRNQKTVWVCLLYGQAHEICR